MGYILQRTTIFIVIGNMLYNEFKNNISRQVYRELPVIRLRKPIKFYKITKFLDKIFGDQTQHENNFHIII